MSATTRPSAPTPTAPGGLPLIGHAHRLARAPFRSSPHQEAIRKYGPARMVTCTASRDIWTELQIVLATIPQNRPRIGVTSAAPSAQAVATVEPDKPMTACSSEASG
ncbi:hypothetical protein JL475_20075 [Streptomyces sp. M2CJ-2]|uniref:hypothetical protein n=1 Tax=Streptomyces sp. M2CJ-2 TaxID=2803948 RepID=UPI001926C807|nr:hypothetical protein [Streptomyces sp. M2CJ-2]MBL3668250.1 hypothetical protein [Streptomyces sp. M2CJ-2]